MSLTSMLNSDTVFREIIKEHLLGKESFVSSKHGKPFATKYTVLVSNTFTNNYYSSLSGTAFDYAARIIVANKSAPRNREELLEEIKKVLIHTCAERGLATAKCKCCDNTISEALNDRYLEAIKSITGYFNGTNKLKDIIPDCCFFARLDSIVRSGGKMPRDGCAGLLNQIPKELLTDVERLCNVFQRAFIISENIHEGSSATYNPSFGTMSANCQGAEGDIYIDGTLYDFKTTKSPGYSWTDAAQIYAYYLLDCLRRISGEKAEKTIDGQIERIALYKARFGIVESFDVRRIPKVQLTDTLIKLKNHLCVERISGKSTGDMSTTGTTADIAAAAAMGNIQAEMAVKLGDKKIREWVDSLWNKK
ncbi:MAG: hypothetical protein LUD78_04335 [Clostridiales bacterium]|nr:hypothetical protein [Clostridiales bacterium]